MNKARSIKQFAQPDALPNFRSLGVTLRILLICNGLAMLAAILMAGIWTEIPLRLVQIAALLTPVLLACILLLWLLQPWLFRLSYRQGVLAVNTLVAALTLAIYHFGGDLYRPPDSTTAQFDLARYILLGILVCSGLLMYFRWRSLAASRVLDGARLQMLQARIRPHFLFNTINAVLAIVRTQPKQAETALEDMADLFRMAMSETQNLVPLRKEIQLCKQYLALEQLRMGDRLQVEWDMADEVGDALIPPLLLQPLLENAVYHGIEPLAQGGSIHIELSRSENNLLLRVHNPYTANKTAPHPGNQIALQNIRERLALLFDIEASYDVKRGEDFYHVEITLPYIKEKIA